MRNWMISTLKIAPMLVGAVVLFAGCESSEGPAEKAGEAIDQAADKAREAVDPAGPAEEAGRKVDDALKDH